MVALKDKEKVDKMRGVDPETGEVILPVMRFRVGSVNAAVWANNGFFNVTLQKSYRDNVTGEWKNTGSFSHGDLFNAMKALERAEVYVSKMTKV